MNLNEVPCLTQICRMWTWTNSSTQRTTCLEQTSRLCALNPGYWPSENAEWGSTRRICERFYRFRIMFKAKEKILYLKKGNIPEGLYLWSKLSSIKYSLNFNSNDTGRFFSVFLHEFIRSLSVGEDTCTTHQHTWVDTNLRIAHLDGRLDWASVYVCSAILRWCEEELHRFP